MTEQEWLVCNDPQKMLKSMAGKVSRRQMGLFAVACCGRSGSESGDPKLAYAVDIAGLHAEGLANETELAIAMSDALSLLSRIETPESLRALVFDVAAYYAALGPGQRNRNLGGKELAESVALFVSQTIVDNHGRQANFKEDSKEYREAALAEAANQAVIARDIFGKVFHSTAIDRWWLNWKGGKISSTAKAIYYERAFARLPALADALQEAGCDNEDILNHCRQPNVHVRGCWVVDLLLGKE